MPGAHRPAGGQTQAAAVNRLAGKPGHAADEAIQAASGGLHLLVRPNGANTPKDVPEGMTVVGAENSKVGCTLIYSPMTRRIGIKGILPRSRSVPSRWAVIVSANKASLDIQQSPPGTCAPVLDPDPSPR
jgi:hypothetical protein